MSSWPDRSDSASDDVEIIASVKADELTFHEPPDTSERTEGRSTIETRRVNLPGRVETGVVYRDVEVDHRLAARLDQERARSSTNVARDEGESFGNSTSS